MLLTLSTALGCRDFIGSVGPRDEEKKRPTPQVDDDDTTADDDGGDDDDDAPVTPPEMERPGPVVPPPPRACQGDETPGPRALRRLTGPQIMDTVRDLFRDRNAPTRRVFDDSVTLGFRVDANKLVVRDLGAQQLMDHAEALARWAVANRLSQLTTCTTNDAGCRGTFIRNFGKRALRAPLSDAQFRAYDMLFAAEPTFNDGAEAVIAAMLQSPYFLYRLELGKPVTGTPGAYALTPHEIASALSYLFTDSLPDDTLMAAADSNALTTPDQIRKQAERLAGDPRAESVFGRFVDGWLELEHLATVVKDDNVFRLTDELRADMMSETHAFVTDVFRSGGTLGQLFTAKHSFVNRRLAEHYGLAGGATGDAPTRVDLPTTTRDPGVLAHASLLTGHATATDSSPVARGKLVRTRILCGDLPPPPAGLDTMLKPPVPGQSTRERYRQHSDDERCSGCHRLMDPIGFGFERYDGFGRRRDRDAAGPIDSSGVIMDVGSAEVPFDGVADLGAWLAKSEEARSCLVRYWSYYTFGVTTWDNDACTYEGIASRASTSDYALKQVMLSVVSSRRFTRRTEVQAQ